MPRRNKNAQETSFESMSGSKIKALMEALVYEWKERIGRADGVRPARPETW